MNLKLTFVERLMLYNQYLILAKLYPDEDMSEISTIITNGYEHEYNELIKPLDEEMDIQKSKFVWDTLTMYRNLNDSYNKLRDKSNIDIDKLKFSGFDNNDETDLYAYTLFIFEDLKRYAELYDPNFDYGTCMEMTSYYENMLDVYNQLNKKYQILTKEEIIAIINAN